MRFLIPFFIHWETNKYILITWVRKLVTYNAVSCTDFYKKISKYRNNVKTGVNYVIYFAVKTF